MTTPSELRSLGVAVPAAGSGARMGGEPKAFLKLGGIPLLLHALRPFLAHPSVRSVAVALPPQDAADPPVWLRDLDARLQIVAGGKTRVQSVNEAIEALDPQVAWVLVHDAARPLVTREIIDRCVRAAGSDEGAVAGLPVVDTLKEVDAGGRVIATPDRARFWGAQTPQIFPRGRLSDAYRRAVSEGISATDDSEVFCRFGGKVRMVEGSPWNLKVTHPEDLPLAEYIHAHVREPENAG